VHRSGGARVKPGCGPSAHRLQRAAQQQAIPPAVARLRACAAASALSGAARQYNGAARTMLMEQAE